MRVRCGIISAIRAKWLTEKMGETAELVVKGKEVKFAASKVDIWVGINMHPIKNEFGV